MTWKLIRFGVMQFYQSPPFSLNEGGSMSGDDSTYKTNESCQLIVTFKMGWIGGTDGLL